MPGSHHHVGSIVSDNGRQTGVDIKLGHGLFKCIDDLVGHVRTSPVIDGMSAWHRVD